MQDARQPAPHAAEHFDVEDGYRHKLRETDPHRLSQRQKAIDKGKNTRSYQCYVQKVPIATRPKAQEREFPWTPDKYEICSARAWLGKVRHWRLRLHKYNPDIEEGEEVIEIPTIAAKGIKKVEVYKQGKKRERQEQQVPESSKRLSLPGPPLDQSPSEPHERERLPRHATRRKWVARRATACEYWSEADEDAPVERLPVTRVQQQKSIYDDWDEEEDVAL